MAYNVLKDTTFEQFSLHSTRIQNLCVVCGGINGGSFFMDRGKNNGPRYIIMQ